MWAGIATECERRAWGTEGRGDIYIFHVKLQYRTVVAERARQARFRLQLGRQARTRHSTGVTGSKNVRKRLIQKAERIVAAAVWGLMFEGSGRGLFDRFKPKSGITGHFFAKISYVLK